MILNMREENRTTRAKNAIADFQPTDDDGLLLGFVYGTLRPGFGNHKWFADCIVKDIGEGTVPGKLYANGIPFLDADGEGQVRGNVFVYDPSHDTFVGLAAMEIGAGYEWRATTATLDDGTELQVGVWHNPYASERGDIVESGDYADCQGWS